MALFCGTVEVLMKCSFAVLLVSFGLIRAVAQDSQALLSVPEETMQALLIHKVKPVPPGEPGMRIAGTVVLNAVINKDGVIESLHMMSEHPSLLPAAIEAVKQWRYRRYEVNGIPKAVTTRIRVEFADASDGETETAPPQEESPVLATAEDMRDRLLYKVAPKYPPLARAARVQGTVILRIIINKLGEVRDTQLLNGHPMLAPAAVDAVKKWRYIPFESDGKAVEIQTEVQVIFRMAGA
jgi:TonB family protein